MYATTASAWQLFLMHAVQVLTWLALPFFQVYADAGDFTVGGRCLTSLKENGLLYGLAGAAGVWTVLQICRIEASHQLHISYAHPYVIMQQQQAYSRSQLTLSPVVPH